MEEKAMTKGIHLGIIVAISLFLLHGAAAQEPTAELTFPTSEEEIIKILGVTPPENILQPRGGLQSSGNDGSLFDGSRRGLSGIADDKDVNEELLENAPKVGALVLFDFDSVKIKDESLPLLEQFARAFQHPALQEAIFVIAGHTDSKGSETYNFSLSEERAKAVKAYLSVTYNLPEERFLVKPFGELRPVATNETDEGRATNRRVEFIRVQ
jgi:outer membrane protein OmpA-like peptidoglycan-associated protein